ncbi:MAG TPA: hypothetical protein VEQ58_20850 [Polyangiaceae bacterium]|nr:hypothetical protein [Polyangiaceae bacterium]
MSRLLLEKWSKRARLLAISATLFGLAGCDDSSAPPDATTPAAVVTAPTPTAEAETGTLSFELHAAGDVTFNSFDYAVTGPNFARAGSIDVSNSNTVSSRIDGLPAAAGYSITVSGTSVGEQAAQCSGSGAFDIVARSVKNLPITISCRLDRAVTPPTGAVAAPLPPFAAWLCGLGLLLLGMKLASRSRGKAVA